MQATEYVALAAEYYLHLAAEYVALERGTLAFGPCSLPHALVAEEPVAEEPA